MEDFIERLAIGLARRKRADNNPASLPGPEFGDNNDQIDSTIAGDATDSGTQLDDPSDPARQPDGKTVTTPHLPPFQAARSASPVVAPLAELAQKSAMPSILRTAKLAACASRPAFLDRARTAGRAYPPRAMGPNPSVAGPKSSGGTSSTPAALVAPAGSQKKADFPSYGNPYQQPYGNPYGNPYGMQSPQSGYAGPPWGNRPFMPFPSYPYPPQQPPPPAYNPVALDMAMRAMQNVQPLASDAATQLEESRRRYEAARATEQTANRNLQRRVGAPVHESELQRLLREVEDAAANTGRSNFNSTTDTIKDPFTGQTRTVRFGGGTGGLFGGGEGGSWWDWMMGRRHGTDWTSYQRARDRLHDAVARNRDWASSQTEANEPLAAATADAQQQLQASRAFADTERARQQQMREQSWQIQQDALRTAMGVNSPGAAPRPQTPTTSSPQAPAAPSLPQPPAAFMPPRAPQASPQAPHPAAAAKAAQPPHPILQ